MGQIHTETDLVALRYPNRQLAAEILRAWEHGLAVLPLDAGLPPPVVTDLLERFRPAELRDERGVTALAGEHPVAATTAAVVLTSGSTGQPKGVELSHEALGWSARTSLRRLGADPGLRWLCCVPVAHVAGLAIVVRSAAAGRDPVVHDRFDPEAVRAESGTELISLVPTQLARLLDAGVDLTGYAAVLLGGGPAGQRLLERAGEAGVRVVQTYGMTETCGGCIYDGIPLDGVSVRLSGERIQLAGPMLMSGYRLEPDRTAAALRDGWLTTTDLGRMRGDGSLEVLGRIDDVIITGGKKVSARRVEELLVEQPEVAEAAVVGLDDPEWGQMVAALVVPAAGHRLDPDVVRFSLRAQAAAHEVPKRIVAVAYIPRTGLGKADKAAIEGLLEP